MNSATLQTKLLSTLAAFTFSVSLLSPGYSQCISGVNGTRYSSGVSIDATSIIRANATSAADVKFIRPTKLYRIDSLMGDGTPSRGVAILDQGNNRLSFVNYDPSISQTALAAQPVIQLPATPFDVSVSAFQGIWTMLDTSGKEYVLKLSTANMVDYSVSTIAAAGVTRKSPVANINIGQYNWIIDGSNVLYRTSVVPAGRQSYTIHQDYFGFASERSLGALAYDGSSLWVANGAALMKLDPTTGLQTGVIPNVGPVQTMIFDGTFLWAGTPSGVLKFDPVTMQQVTGYSAALPGPATSLIFDGAWLWSATGDGSIHRARACDMADLGSVSLPAVPQSILMTSEGLWITYPNSPVVSLR